MFYKNKLSQAIFTLSAALAAGSVCAQNAPAQTAGGEPEELLVQGFRASLVKATEQKRNAASIQDSIVAEDIGKFPDQNVAESLQRITGVSISRTNGEGSKITVRGFGPAFNTVRVNNRTLATSEGGREFDFQILPSELIAGADVVKAPTANIEAGSIGASVNVKTARPLDSTGFKASGSVNMAYGELSGKADPEFSGILSNTFADDTIGVLVGFSHKEASNRIDNYRTNRWHELYAMPAGLSGEVRDEAGNISSAEGFRRPGRAVFEIQDETRERTGANIVLQWAPNENWTTTVDALYTDLSRQALSMGVQIPTQATQYSNVVIDADETLVSATITDNNIDLLDRQVGQESTTSAIGFNTVFNRDALTLKFDASFSEAESTPRINEFVPHFNLPSNPTGRSIDLDYGAGDVLNVTSTIDVTDISSIRGHWNGPGHNEINDEVSEFKFDGSYELEAGMLTSIDAGVAYSEREKTLDAFNAWSGGADNFQCAPCGGELAATFANPEKIFGMVEYSDYMSDEPGNFPREWLVIKDMNAYIDGIQEMMERNWYKDANGAWQTDDGTLGTPLIAPGKKWFTDHLDMGASYANKENSVSAYTQANLAGVIAEHEWSGNVGLRYIATENTAAGFGQTVDNITLNPSSNNSELRLDVVRSAAQALTAKSDDDYLLPSANFSFTLDDGLYLRAAAAQTITRPAMSDTGVNQNVGVDNAGSVTRTGSNPYLKPYEVNQFDLSLEYYADNSDAFSIAYFSKDISSFISTVSSVQDYDGAVDAAVIAHPAYPAGGLRETTTIKQNRSGGSVAGWELAALHHMDYLPGIWSGLGVQANYTYATSKDDGADPINQPGIIEPGSALEGFAKESYNLTAFYEYDDFQARLAYNWRGRFMHARDGGAEAIAATLPVHTEAYGQLDMSLSYDLNESITLSAEAINLLNERRLEYVDVRSRVSLVQYTGARYQLGVRARF